MSSLACFHAVCLCYADRVGIFCALFRLLSCLFCFAQLARTGPFWKTGWEGADRGWRAAEAGGWCVLVVTQYFLPPCLHVDTPDSVRFQPQTPLCCSNSHGKHFSPATLAKQMPSSATWPASFFGGSQAQSARKHQRSFAEDAANEGISQVGRRTPLGHRFWQKVKVGSLLFSSNLFFLRHITKARQQHAEIAGPTGELAPRPSNAPAPPSTSVNPDSAQSDQIRPAIRNGDESTEESPTRDPGSEGRGVCGS